MSDPEVNPLAALGESLSRGLIQVTAAFERFGQQITAAVDAMAGVFAQAGYLPPDPRGLPRGARWTSPFGEEYRIAGRRGHRHWVPATKGRSKGWYR